MAQKKAVPKRKDSKGRVLKEGESQRPDGRYEYKYTDSFGKRKSVYSWRLNDSDGLPAGKRDCESLRSLENKIQKDLMDGIDTDRANKTLNQLFDENMEVRKLRDISRAKYFEIYKELIRNTALGQMPICKIKYSDMLKFCNSMIDGRGCSIPTVSNIIHIINPVFNTAVRDGIIRSNPLTGLMSDIKRTRDYKQPKRHSLETKQELLFLNFVYNSDKYKHHFPLFFVMFRTGCRISEVSGLRWEDVNFSNNFIDINHNLTYFKRVGDDKSTFHIDKPKSAAGIRKVPLFSDVKSVLMNEYARQAKEGFCKAVVDGYSGFIFTNKHNHLYRLCVVDSLIHQIVNKYNFIETEKASQENRETNLIPDFSAHITRHTFTTELCKSETNLGLIQSILGHADISTTMNIYNEITEDFRKQAFEELEEKMSAMYKKTKDDEEQI